MRLLTAMMVLALAGSVQAKSLKKANFNDNVQISGKTLTLNGLGLRLATIFDINVYVGSLYLEKKEQDATKILDSKGPKLIELAFLRGVSGKKLQGAWSDCFENNAANPQTFKVQLAQLNSSMKEVKNGDRVRFEFVPANVTVKINDIVTGTVEKGGAGFQKVLLSCWIGPKPPNKELKSGMLGL